MTEKLESQPQSDRNSYFGSQSTWGVTKHMGGLDATIFLADQCKVDTTQHVLVVGCGSGVSSCFLARTYGCQLTGIDLEQRMVDWSISRAEKTGMASTTNFRLADAQNLPFPDNTFDTVIIESVLAFVPDKTLAVRELLRVIKPGGLVGINECIWHQPPPAEFLAFIKNSMGNVDFLAFEEWQKLFEKEGFALLNSEARRINAFQQWKQDLKERKEAQVRGEKWRAWKQFFKMYMTDKSFRAYAKTITPSMKTLRSFFQYLGYTLIIAQKPE